MERVVGEIREELFCLRDGAYREFQAKLLPTVPADAIIGVRTPELRRYAKQLIKREDAALFLDALPHGHFDENQLHAFLVSEIKDYGECVAQVNRFLPHIDNWATCDQLSPRVFAEHRGELIGEIDQWLRSGETYTLRFGIGMLMQHYLDDAFDPACPEKVALLRSEEYYVNMMVAWYFATALAKQYEAALPYLEQGRLDSWTHNKAIQKALESYRITPEQKEYLKSLKISSRKNRAGR
jgi:3-methyladenine DNA glycosylase AlkD